MTTLYEGAGCAGGVKEGASAADNFLVRGAMLLSLIY